MKKINQIKPYILIMAAAITFSNCIYAQDNTDYSPMDVDVDYSKQINQPVTTDYEEAEKILPSENSIDNVINQSESFKPALDGEVLPLEDNTKEENLTNENKPKEPSNLSKTLSARAVIVDLISDKLEYIQENDTFVATGSAKVIVSEQNAELIADKITYYQGEQYLTAEGNLQIKKDNKIINGNFARVDLNKESALVTNPNAVISKVRMSAKEANLYPEYIELNEGQAILNQQNIDVSLSASEYKPKELGEDIPGRNSVIPENPDTKKPRYKIVAKEIELDRSKKTNNLIIKNAKVYIGKIKVAALPRLTLTVGEDAKVVEAMMPEIGFDKTIGGIYFGPSLTLDLPKSSTLRVSPIFSAFGRDSAVGGGGIARFRSSFNKTDVAYTTTGNRLVLKGEQKLYKDTTKIKYSVNEYPDNGFLGTGFYRPLYLVELVDERKVGKLLNHNIFTRFGSGIARDVNDGIATPRVQLQGNIISEKPLLRFKDYVELRLQSQFNVAAYGTGDTYAVVRGGPRVDWNLGRLDLTTSYMQAGIWGDTPFVFDEYIRGKSNLILAGDFKITKFLSIGNIRSLNLSRDGSDPRLSTENQFYARVGPEDFKFRIGYDVARKRSTFGLDLFLGSGRSALNFDKMKILHPDLDMNY
jgi:hypothetical protein